MWRSKNYSIKYTNEYKELDISFFRKHWYLDVDFRSWTITWSINWKKTWSISVEVKKVGQGGACTERDQRRTLRVYFTQTDRTSWEKKDFDYTIQLVTTQCNYGWVRYWFTCPCGWNRCWKLYLQSNWYFASRKTLWLKYEEQNQSHKWREMNRVFPYCWKAEELYSTIKYKYRSGKATRKYKRYMHLMREHIPDSEIMKLEQSLLIK